MRSILIATALTVAQAVTPPLAPASLVSEVQKLTSARDNDGRFEAVTGLLREHDLPFTVEPFTIDRPRSGEPRTAGRNIVVTVGEGPGDIVEIVVGAHYDAARLPGGALSGGAVDNAGSCVLLVQLAESLRNERLPVRVRFVWFDMEELGLFGSAQYVEAHKGDRIKAMLNFDINAYGDTILFAPPPSGGAPRTPQDAWLRTTMEGACTREKIECLRLEQLPAGDDQSFGRASIPALSIATLPALEANQLFLMLDPSARSRLGPPAAPAVMQIIHTPQDVLARVDGASIARTHRLALALLRALAAP